MLCQIQCSLLRCLQRLTLQLHQLRQQVHQRNPSAGAISKSSLLHVGRPTPWANQLGNINNGTTSGRQKTVNAIAGSNAVVWEMFRFESCHSWWHITTVLRNTMDNSADQLQAFTALLFIAAAEANSQTSTGSADPLTTSRPPDPRNFSGPASGNPSAVESSDVVSSAPSTNEISSIAEATSSAESPGLPTRSASETAEAMASQATTTSGAVDSAPSAGSGILQETAASSSDTAAQAASANSGNDASFLSSLEDAKNGLFDNFKDATSSAAQSVEGKCLRPFSRGTPLCKSCQSVLAPVFHQGGLASWYAWVLDSTLVKQERPIKSW